MPRDGDRFRETSKVARRGEDSQYLLGERCSNRSSVDMGLNEVEMVVPADNPITAADQDTLGRNAAATALAAEIRVVDASEGYVVGVLGPWGSGKTSLINLIREHLAKSPTIEVVEFNPWMFSGAEQLVERFFTELAAQLRVRSQKGAELAADIETYSEVVAPLRYLPLLGPWIERLRGGAKALRRLQELRSGGVEATRRRLEGKLRELKRPIVVVIDDIDRLHTDEIRDIFKLVRLTASFPNIVYLLAFDRGRVERALAEEGLEGRDYLEKILQTAYDIPLIPARLLTRELGAHLESALDGIEDPGPFNVDLWPDIHAELVRPLVRNMRDVRRFVAAARGSVKSLGGQVELADVLALEAVRVFRPDVFETVVSAREALTSTSAPDRSGAERPDFQASVDEVFKAGGEEKELVRALIRRLFPGGRRFIENYHHGSESLGSWLRARRVAHPDILALYLERVVGEGLEAFNHAERAHAVMSDAQELERLFEALSPHQAEDAIAALEVFEGEYPQDAVEPATVVLMNQLDRLVKRDRGFFDYGPDLTVVRVVLRLIRQLDDTEQAETTVRRVLPNLRTMSSKLRLLNLVGHDEGVGHELISLEQSRSLEREFRDDVREASPETLVNEQDVLDLLRWTQISAGADEPPHELAEHDGLELAVLRAAVTDARSQELGSRAVTRSLRLRWDTLAEVFGSEENLRRRVDRIDEEQLDEDSRLAVELARKYLTGWRSDNHS